MSPVAWPPGIDGILDGDLVVMLAYVTPARGTVLLPVNNFRGVDRQTGTITAINSSVGAWRKLDRLANDPKVAIVYHAREHGDSDAAEYVLVQGNATLSRPIADYPSSILERWERFEDWSQTPRLWRRWQRIYALRVQITITVERVLVWDDLRCTGSPRVYGAPLPERPPASQRAPLRGTAPRIAVRRAARRAAGLPNVLVGWVDQDGYPIVMPTAVCGVNDSGFLLDRPGLLPAGGRRAGLTAHRFSAGAIGQNQRKHTGWLHAEQETGSVSYAPHTQSNYRFPRSKMLYRLFSGGATRWGLRQRNHRRAKRA